METLISIGIAFLSSSITTGILTIIFKESLKAFISNSIKYEFDRKLEDYKTNEIMRMKAILIADLISEWISKPEDNKRLNQLTFEAFIWLPKDIAIKLSKLLTLSPDGPNTREVLAEVRELIIGRNEKIDPNLIIIFSEKIKDS